MMASHRRKLDPPRRLKQSSLLGGFSKSDRQSVSLNGGEDEDPVSSNSAYSDILMKWVYVAVQV